MHKLARGVGSALRGVLAGLLTIGAMSAGYAKGPADYELLLEKRSEGVSFDDTPWKEIEAVLPPAPREENLRAIDVNQLTDNRFYVDEASVEYGADDVIRYTMLIVSASGAKNISFEGMRCETAERRIYAFQRADGSWSKARNSAWARIEGGKLNRQHAALYRDYFCTTGGSVGDTAGARRVLRTGNPAAIAR